MRNDEIAHQIYHLYLAIYDCLAQDQHIEQKYVHKDVIAELIKQINIFDSEDKIAAEITFLIKKRSFCCDPNFETDLRTHLFSDGRPRHTSLLVLIEIKCEIATVQDHARYGRKLRKLEYLNDNIKNYIIQHESSTQLFFSDLPFVEQPKGILQKIWLCCYKPE